MSIDEMVEVSYQHFLVHFDETFSSFTICLRFLVVSLLPSVYLPFQTHILSLIHMFFQFSYRYFLFSKNSFWLE